MILLARFQPPPPRPLGHSLMGPVRVSQPELAEDHRHFDVPLRDEQHPMLEQPQPQQFDLVPEVV